MDKKELREKYIRIGVITSPHGIKGEVNVFPTTNNKEMFKTLESCYMLDKNGLQPKKVMGCKYFKKLVILQFEDVVDRNTSETLRQKELYIARDEANILGEKQYYVTDLIGCSCQDEEGNDFGVIKEADGKVSHTFVIKNEGEAPLVVTRVIASCGCTTPEWTKEPIAPGKTGDIKVTYNPAGRPGPFSKSISVYSNGKTGSFLLTIRGEVKEE